MLKCPNCGEDVPDIEEKCLTCGYNAGPPNVRAAERAEERLALEERYQKAFEAAKTGGSLAILEKFEEAVKRSSAVINVHLTFLQFFIADARNLYANYEQAAGRTRKPSSLPYDRERRAIGGSLFGGYAHEIIYAALSLDGSGLQSYGPYAVKLREIAIRNRATVLENNSYDFVNRHNLVKPGTQPPPGYMATWDNRHKLAVAKLSAYITPSTVEADFPRLLLSSTGDRATDEFIEAHIYGTFDLNAIESVKGSSTLRLRDEERELLPIVKRRLKNSGKDWVEG